MFILLRGFITFELIKLADNPLFKPEREILDSMFVLYKLF